MLFPHCTAIWLACFAALQDTEWFESKRSKRGGRGGGSRPGTASSSRPATGSSSRAARSAPPPAAAGSQASPLPSFFALEELGDAEGDDVTAAKLAGRGGGAAVAAAVVVPDLEGFELEADEPEVRWQLFSSLKSYVLSAIIQKGCACNLCALLIPFRIAYAATPCLLGCGG
jgi:hypothetical protein